MIGYWGARALNFKRGFMEKQIIYCGQKAKVACDEKCSKAWGTNSRAQIHLSEDENDTCYLADDELGEAPLDPGTYEGDHAKPTCATEMMNKWCVRECERCVLSRPGEYNKELVLPDFSRRVYNLAWRSKEQI